MQTHSETVAKPWPALWALVLGFFMILIDTTIVSVANPSIMDGLGTDINSVIWVTSAYLLAYAVPLLITGRLGDRFGPKNLYLLGLVLFTGASAWCGFSGDISTLIAARVVQGLGAALMTPQTMAVITRIFPPERRGAAMGLWGATAGVATLVGAPKQQPARRHPMRPNASPIGTAKPAMSAARQNGNLSRFKRKYAAIVEPMKPP